MVETLDTKWFDVRIQFFQCATIPITELKFELNPEFQFFFRSFGTEGRKKWTRAVDPTLYTHTHITKIFRDIWEIFYIYFSGLCIYHCERIHSGISRNLCQNSKIANLGPEKMFS